MTGVWRAFGGAGRGGGAFVDDATAGDDDFVETSELNGSLLEKTSKFANDALVFANGSLSKPTSGKQFS